VQGASLEAHETSLHEAWDSDDFNDDLPLSAPSSAQSAPPSVLRESSQQVASITAAGSASSRRRTAKGTGSRGKGRGCKPPEKLASAAIEPGRAQSKSSKSTASKTADARYQGKNGMPSDVQHGYTAGTPYLSNAAWNAHRHLQYQQHLHLMHNSLWSIGMPELHMATSKHMATANESHQGEAASRAMMQMELSRRAMMLSTAMPAVHSVAACSYQHHKHARKPNKAHENKLEHQQRPVQRTAHVCTPSAASRPTPCSSRAESEQGAWPWQVETHHTAVGSTNLEDAASQVQKNDNQNLTHVADRSVGPKRGWRKCSKCSQCHHWNSECLTSVER
jgi:hypothetical protein